MKKKLFLLPLCLLTLSVMGCQGGKETTPSSSGEPAQSASEPTESSSAEQITFDAYTLDQLHEARAAKELSKLEKKYVSVKGKVTFNKLINDGDATLYIQNGKYAVEVTYSGDFQVNVGDSVEVKGQLAYIQIGDTGTIFLSAYSSVSPNYDIKVINEAISTETVQITKEAELVEYDSSLAQIDFTVVGSRTNAAFIGKLAEGDEQIIVAPKLSIAEKVEPDTYKVDDRVRYEGVFTYSGDNSAKVLRYLDKAGLSTLK